MYNNFNDKLKFTIEIETNNKQNALDLILIKNNNKIHTNGTQNTHSDISTSSPLTSYDKKAQQLN